MELQENQPHNRSPCAGAVVPVPCSPQACLAAFRFQPPHARIDWRALHGLDVEALARTTDIDALERVLDVVAFGDIEAEDARNLTPLNFIKLFRLAQLTVEYLLFVQDRLAADNCVLKGEVGKLHSQVEVLRLKVKEQREQATAGRKELRQLKRSMRTLEALALAGRLSQPEPPAPRQPEVQVVERVVETADPVVQYKLERMGAEVKELTEEREAMHRELLQLRDALHEALARGSGASESAIAAAVEAARREERSIAEQRIQAAVERERRAVLRDSKAKLSVVAESEELRALQGKLAESLRRQRELEKEKDMLGLELAHALGSPKQGAWPGAQMQQLREELEEARSEVRALQQLRHSGSKSLNQRPASQVGRPQRSSGGLSHAPGLGSQLDDASEASDARVEQLLVEVNSLKAELSTAFADRAEAEQDTKQLQHELQDVLQQLDQLQRRQSRRSADWCEAELKRLDDEVTELRAKNKEQQSEIAALRRGAAAATAAASPSAAQASLPAVSAAPVRRLKAQHVASKHAGEEAATERAALGSPIEETVAVAEGVKAAVASPQAHSPRVRALYREDHRSQQGSPTRRQQGRGSPHHSSPAAAWQAEFDEEMCCTLGGHERPGVVSRFPHSLGAMLQMRKELLGELGAEVERELASYGISSRAQRLTDSQFRAAMEELEARREEARAGMSAHDRQRADYARATITTHVDKVARQLFGQRHSAAQRVEQGDVLSPPRSLRPIRTRSDEQERPGSPGAAVVRAGRSTPADAEAPSDPFYSPLRSHVSQLSFTSREALDGSPLSPLHGGRSPRALVCTASGPLVRDEDGTPRSPWAITHDRVFRSLDVGGADSPLASGAGARRRGSAGRSPSPLSSPVRSPGGGWGRSPLPPPAEALALGWRSAAGAQRRQGSSPGAAHRYSPGADMDSPVTSPQARRQLGSGVVRDRRGDLSPSMDKGSDGAESVRPAARADALRSSGGSPPKRKVQ